MGYRSQVVLAVGKELKPYFLTALASSQNAASLVFKETDHFEEDGYNDGTMLMSWSGIKWYDSYEEINIIEKFISDCETESLEGWETEQDEEHGYAYQHLRFLRIGEDYDDVVDRGEHCYGNIHISREIQF
jgi:uncharacterized protein Yka (UPF0111/DUF47 family)|tara:strand:- start:84 stop:476 length:393 start_codon:yes stop_codon:yes gene_type:complete